MAILVTGGAGFIGSHFIERLLSWTKAQIICLDNFNDYYDPALKRANVRSFVENPQVTLVEQSFCDAPAMQRLFAVYSVDQVVHLGAYAGVRASLTQPFMYQQANVGGTLALLEAARLHPVSRFLSASSSTVYGRGAAVPFREDAPLGTPMSPYGASKRAAEVFALTYFDLYQVPVVVLRPFSVYGPRLRPDLAMTIFTDAIARGRPMPLYGDGTVRRDFTHVSDICDGLLSALDAEGVVGEVINLGHNEPVEMRRLIAMLEEALKKKAVLDHQPEVPGEMPVTCADLTKAQRLLGYRPQVELSDGIGEFVDWYCATHLNRGAFYQTSGVAPENTQPNSNNGTE